jgi:hypothetical protein
VRLSQLETSSKEKHAATSFASLVTYDRTDPIINHKSRYLSSLDHASVYSSAREIFWNILYHGTATYE